MIKFFFKKSFLIFLVLFSFSIPFFTYAIPPVVNLDGPSLVPKSEIFMIPEQDTSILGSTFSIPIYINTKGYDVNAIGLKISFDPSKIAVVKPFTGKSIFGIWVEPPNYDNIKGTASLVGVIPNGIVTEKGLIGTITFKSLAIGETNIIINDYTSANLNDGFGTNIKLTLGKVSYKIIPKPIEKDIEKVENTEVVEPILDTKVNDLQENKCGIQAVDSYFSIGGYSLLLLLVILYFSIVVIIALVIYILYN
ncbi:MAG TPA: cohesin domain-containing protein [Candidatus Paceibacterota bacterium]|nr:cohesin domain-containing protein [Candidatus Paceibacterota bacterium]HPT17866.1 cohesin domain-containing protein [Candidatus Paceibacterota bacterium]